MTSYTAHTEIESFLDKQMCSFLCRFEFMENAVIRASQNLSRYSGLQEYSNGYYLGGVTNGQRNGFGAYVLKSGSSINSIYIGEWRDGHKDGKGIMLTSRICYNGEFKDGHYHGRGVFVSCPDLVFEAVFDRGDIYRLLSSNSDFSFNGKNYYAR